MAKKMSSHSKPMAETEIFKGSFYVAIATTIILIFSGITATIELRIPSLISGIMLIPAFVTLMACIHEYSTTKRKLFTNLGLLFAIGYAVLIGFNYYMQLTLATQPRYSESFNMKSPLSIMWVIEVLGYGFMGLATLSAAWVFHKTTIEKIIKWLFVINGGLGVGGMLGYALGWNMNLLIAGLIGWDLIMPVSTILLSIVFWKAQHIDGRKS
jgi:hypothetical protein